MRAVRTAGLCVAAISTALGLHGLYNSKPLPLSQRLGGLAPVDLDHDGRITAAEWARAGRLPKAMAALDRNGNGFIEPQEARSRRGGGGGGE